MKTKNILVTLTILVWVLGCSLWAGIDKPKTDEETIKTWQQFSSQQNLRTLILETSGKEEGADVRMQMAQIKMALEKAGISEPVSIHYVTGKGHLMANLGTYQPILPASKSMPEEGNVLTASAGAQSPSSQFSTIPPVKETNLVKSLATPAVPMSASPLLAATPGPKLVFKTLTGEIRAVIAIRVEQRLPKKDREKRHIEHK